MKLKITSILVLAFALSSFLCAQPTQEWVSRYNGTGNGDDNASSIVVDGSGNVYITGWSLGSGTQEDYITIKYNSQGVQQWAARYDYFGSSQDRANSITIDGAGNVYVTGMSFNLSGPSYATIKYNSMGIEQWVARYAMGIASSIAIDGSGNVYVTGETSGNLYATIKYNSVGVQQWVQTNLYGSATSIAVDGVGYVYVTGHTHGQADYATIKYNPAGVQQWIQIYDGLANGEDVANSLVLDGSGNVYVTGYSRGIGSDLDYATIKYNTSGVEQWVARYNGTADSTDVATSLKVDASGNVYVTGESEGTGTNSDYATIKYNTSGIEQWVSRYDGSANLYDKANAIEVDGSGNAYVSGSSWGNGTDLDYATIKYNSTGVQQWIQSFNGPVNSADEANSIAVDGIGNVYVTGVSAGNGTLNDYATIKYSQTLSNVFEQTGENTLFSLYPNPAKDIITLDIDFASYTDLTLSIYDLIGNTVKSEKLSRNLQQINIEDLSNGIYLIEIKSKELSEKQKLIINR